MVFAAEMWCWEQQFIIHGSYHTTRAQHTFFSLSRWLFGLFSHIRRFYEAKLYFQLYIL